VHSVGDVESLVIFHSLPARPTARVAASGRDTVKAWKQDSAEALKTA